MKKLIVLLLMILPLGAIAQEVKIAFVKNSRGVYGYAGGIWYGKTNGRLE